jgi:hypothetical protein
MGLRVGLSAAGVVAAVTVGLVAFAVKGSSDAEDDPAGRDAAATSPMSSASSDGSTSGPSTSPEPEAGPPLLLPNMRSLGASDLQLEQRGVVRRLRFAASLANLGPGPLLLDPRGRGACGPRQITADQLLHVDGNESGEFERASDPVREQRLAGCMHDHPDHDHWHFRAMASYVLHDLSGQVVAAQAKVSFCLRDNERVPDAPIVVRREHFGECSRRGVQGISPGWVDIYPADLDGQALRLPEGLTAGDFCLVLRADPLGRIVETDEADNAKAIGVRIGADDVRRVPASSACAPVG